MRQIIIKSIFVLFFILSSQAKAQLVIEDNSTYITTDQMLLANEMFESGEPYAESLGYNLDNLDPLDLDSPDSTAYTLGIENYEYSRYLLGTLTARSALGLHMMWSPVVMANAAMQDESFDGTFTGGTANGYKEDDMLMMMIKKFGENANQTPPSNAFPQFADFIQGDNNLPSAVASNFEMDFSTLKWNRNLMDKTLNLGAMGQSLWKQYFWASDMLSAFHDGNDEGIEATGSNSPDLPGSPEFDPNNNIFYGGNNLDGYIGQVLTAVSINKTNFLIHNLAYNGTSLTMVDPATYDPSTEILYFPTRIKVTEAPVTEGLPPKASTFTVEDKRSLLFDQLSYLLGTVSFKNMMNPATGTDPAHKAFNEVFDGYPFPVDMSTSATNTPGPYDLMMGTSKVLFLNIKAMHYNGDAKTFVDESNLDASGSVVMGNNISAENAAYIIVALSKFSEEFGGTPLKAMADGFIVNQADFIIANFKDQNTGGYFNSYTLGTGGSSSTKTLQANAAIIRGLYAAHVSTGNNTYLTEANTAYNYLINNFYNADEKVFKTSFGNPVAEYNPRNLAMLSGALREARLVGTNLEASIIYTRVFKTIYNKMVLSETSVTGEVGSDSDGDGIPFIVGGNKPPIFAARATYTMEALALNDYFVNGTEVNVFPNPARSHISIGLNLLNNTNVDITVYDIQGRKASSLQNLELFSGKQQINVSLNTLKPGVYFIKTSSNNEPLSINRFVIK